MKKTTMNSWLKDDEDFVYDWWGREGDPGLNEGKLPARRKEEEE